MGVGCTAQFPQGYRASQSVFMKFPTSNCSKQIHRSSMPSRKLCSASYTHPIGGIEKVGRLRKPFDRDHILLSGFFQCFYSTHFAFLQGHDIYILGFSLKRQTSKPSILGKPCWITSIEPWKISAFFINIFRYIYRGLAEMKNVTDIKPQKVFGNIIWSWWNGFF